MSEAIALPVPADLVEALAEAVAERLDRPGPEPWIDVEAAAEHLSCNADRIYALTSARRIPFEKDGSRLLFRRSELDAWVQAGGGLRP